jgi:hypothetical protein
MSKEKKPWKKPQLVVTKIEKQCQSFIPGKPVKSAGFTHCYGDGEERCKLCKLFKA